EAFARPFVRIRIEGHDAQEITFGIAAFDEQWLLDHRPEQVGGRLQGHALIATGALHLEDLARFGWDGDARSIRTLDDLAIEDGLEHVEDAPILGRADQIRAKFIADPDLSIQILNALRVKIRAGQVSAFSRFRCNPEWHLLVRVVQENGFLDVDLSRPEIRLHPM